MPGFGTWAFWNSQLVTTIIGGLIFTAVIALIALVISHRLEKRRKLFDFQLDIFRKCSEKVSEFVNEFFELISMKDKLNHEDFKKAVEAVAQRHDRFALHFVSHVGPAFRDGQVSIQIAKLHVAAIENIFRVMKGPDDWGLDTVVPFIDRYTTIWLIVMVRMRREMDLIGFDEYHGSMWELEKDMMKLEMTNT